MCVLSMTTAADGPNVYLTVYGLSQCYICYIYISINMFISHMYMSVWLLCTDGVWVHVYSLT